MLHITIKRVPPRPRALIEDVARAQLRERVALAKRLIRHKSHFHGWLQCALLDKHELTACNCGLVNCR